MDDIIRIIQVSEAPTINIEPNTTYQELGYEDNKTIDIVDNMKSLSKDIISDVEEIINNFNTLKDKYDEFTDFNPSMQQACTNLMMSAQEIEKKVDFILNILITILKNMAVEDEKLLDDLNSLNKLLTGNSSEGTTQSVDISYNPSSSGSGAGREQSVQINNDNISGEAVVGEQPMPPSANTSPEVQTSGVFDTPAATIEAEPVPTSPNPTGGIVSGLLSPGTTAATYPAQAYNLPDQEYKVLCATVYAEAAEGNSYTTSDTMGVTSTILNRVEAGIYGGNTITDVVSAKNQFKGYGYQNQKFAAAMSNPDIISPEMRAAIDRTLAGERNTTGMSFSGGGTHNIFK